MNTRQRILDVALELFSERGFGAVSVRDIARAVGVKESALYRHFASKQAVLDTIVEAYQARCEAFMGGIHAVIGDDPAALSAQAREYEHMDDETFLRIGRSVFTDFLMRPDVMRFWRMASIERHHDPHIAALYERELFEKPLAFQAAFFAILTRIGALMPADPEALAMAFYLPLLALYLRALPFEPDHPVALDSVRLGQVHMQNFRAAYAISKGERS